MYPSETGNRLKVVCLRRPPFVLVTSVVLATLLVACGREENRVPADQGAPQGEGHVAPLATVPPEQLEEIGGDPARQGQTDPCSLLTKAEVEEVLQQPVAEIYRHTRPTVLCEYFVEGEPFGSVTIRLGGTVSEAEFQSEIELAEELGGSEATEVSGIGDLAFAVGPLLYVYQEGALLLTAAIVRGKTDLDGAKEVALIALHRLP